MQGESWDEQLQSVAMEISECSDSKVDYNKMMKKSSHQSLLMLVSSSRM